MPSITRPPSPSDLKPLAFDTYEQVRKDFQDRNLSKFREKIQTTIFPNRPITVTEFAAISKSSTELIQTVISKEAQDRLTGEHSPSQKLNNTSLKVAQIFLNHRLALPTRVCQSIARDTLLHFDQSYPPLPDRPLIKDEVFECLKKELDIATPMEVDDSEKTSIQPENDIFFHMVHACGQKALLEASTLFLSERRSLLLERTIAIPKEKEFLFMIFYLQRAFKKELDLGLSYNVATELGKDLIYNSEQLYTKWKAPLTLLKNPLDTFELFFGPDASLEPSTFLGFFASLDRESKFPLIDRFLRQEANEISRKFFCDTPDNAQKNKVITKKLATHLTQTLPKIFGLQLIGDAAHQLAKHSLHFDKTGDSTSSKEAYRHKLFIFSK